MSPEALRIFYRHASVILDLTTKAKNAGDKDVAVVIFEDERGEGAVAVSGAREKLLRDRAVTEGLHENALRRALERPAPSAWILVRTFEGETHSFEANIVPVLGPVPHFTSRGGVS